MDNIYTYEDYLKEDKTLALDQMQRLHRDMTEEIGRDKDALELYTEFVEKAAKYAEIRARWLLMERAEKMQEDSLRTDRHNAVIRQLNMLARYLRQQGKIASWRDMLGDEANDPYCRKTIGDFACYVVFVNSINAR